MEQNEFKELASGRKPRESMAVYARIALDIARRIINEEIKEGSRLSGRSTMSSEYGVSPETIRRSFFLLEEMQVVEVLQNSGVRVLSKKQAVKYFEKYNKSSETRNLLSKMRSLIEKHEELDRELFSLAKEMLNVSEHFNYNNPFPVHEFQLEEGSAALGKTLSDLDFWRNTGATVIAINSGGEIILSPGPYRVLGEKDILLYVGRQETLALVEQLLR